MFSSRRHSIPMACQNSLAIPSACAMGVVTPSSYSLNIMIGDDHHGDHDVGDHGGDNHGGDKCDDHDHIQRGSDEVARPPSSPRFN